MMGFLTAPQSPRAPEAGVGVWDCSPVQQPLLQLLQHSHVKVKDSWEFAQTTPQLLPGQCVFALLVHFIQGPHNSSVEILKPERPVTHGLIDKAQVLPGSSPVALEAWPTDRLGS